MRTFESPTNVKPTAITPWQSAQPPTASRSRCCRRPKTRTRGARCSGPQQRRSSSLCTAARWCATPAGQMTRGTRHRTNCIGLCVWVGVRRVLLCVAHCTRQLLLPGCSPSPLQCCAFALQRVCPPAPAAAPQITDSQLRDAPCRPQVVHVQHHQDPALRALIHKPAWLRGCVCGAWSEQGACMRLWLRHAAVHTAPCKWCRTACRIKPPCKRLRTCRSLVQCSDPPEWGWLSS